MANRDDMSNLGDLLALHNILERSHAHGPGARAVVSFHGCSLSCPGCFVPETHAGEPRFRLTVFELVRRLGSYPDIEGVTLTGGEPLEQPRLPDLLVHLRRSSDLSVVLYSGYSLNEIRYLPGGAEVLAHIDVLIDGRYRRKERVTRGLVGSVNQTIHLLSQRYRATDLAPPPPPKPPGARLAALP